jgi:hypothetical protein
MVTNQADFNTRLTGVVYTDTQLTEPEVDAFVANNDYVTSTNITDDGTIVDINGDVSVDMMRYTGINDSASLDTTIVSMYCGTLNSTYSQVIKQTIAESCASTCSRDATYTICS